MNSDRRGIADHFLMISQSAQNVAAMLASIPEMDDAALMRRALFLMHDNNIITLGERDEYFDRLIQYEAARHHEQRMKELVQN